MARVSGDDTIRVDGIKELNAALKEFGDEFKGEMRRTLKTIADVVAEDARGTARGLGSTAGHVAPSLRASAGAQFAAVSGSDPAFAGAEFGSNRYRQFKPWLGSGEGAGYFLWPTIRKDGPRIEQEASDGMNRLIKKAGLG